MSCKFLSNRCFWQAGTWEPKVVREVLAQPAWGGSVISSRLTEKDLPWDRRGRVSSASTTAVEHIGTRRSSSESISLLARSSLWLGSCERWAGLGQTRWCCEKSRGDLTPSCSACCDELQDGLEIYLLACRRWQSYLSWLKRETHGLLKKTKERTNQPAQNVQN